MTDSIRVEENAVYGAAGRDLLCDLYHPEPATRNRAATLLLHGGGWRGGDKAMMRNAGLAFAARGYLAIAVGYRLTGEAPWPAQLDDTRTALRWARSKAVAFGVEPAQVMITGFSAGAHLGLLAAGTASADAERPAAVAAFFPPTRMAAELLGRMANLSPEEAEAANPIANITGSFPPAILLHGTGDTLVPYTESTAMFEALREADATTDLRLYAGLPHEFVQLPGCMEDAIGAAAGFFQRTVLGRAAFDDALAEMQRVWAERMRAMRAAAPA
ncbi:MAG TPA: alpha/beta hydrolase [Dehalococcoidia bacterium]|jgi:acetyl esterase/lipase|nr:alpha/beta hydrolase [Dehalococcoidia bacterium]